MEKDVKHLNWSVFITLIGLCGIVADSHLADSTNDTWTGIKTRLFFPNNFASVRINIHHEKELRIAYKKVLCMETSMKSILNNDLDMVIRQVTDGQRLVQAVYQGGLLKECDFTKGSSQILDFVASFISPEFNSHTVQYGDVLEAYAINNSTETNHTLAYRYFDIASDLKQLSHLVDMKALHKECDAFYSVARSIALKAARSGKNRNVYASLVANDPAHFNIKYPSTIETDKNTNHKLSKRSTEPLKRSRSKRASFDFSSVLIFPGTKWCGKGDLATCYEDLGDDQDLDACCRDHDCCPFVVYPFERRFNLFNYRFHSLLHCDCDQRFRGCLKQSVSTMANMIGKIYFNILGSRCFEFEETEFCAERSWWGRCNRVETQVSAVVKNQVSYAYETPCEKSNTTTSTSTSVPSSKALS